MDPTDLEAELLRIREDATKLQTAIADANQQLVMLDRRANYIQGALDALRAPVNADDLTE